MQVTFTDAYKPYRRCFEKRIAALEGGVAALAVASGAAAVTYTIENLDVAIYTEMGRFMMGPYGCLVTTAIHESIHTKNILV